MTKSSLYLLFCLFSVLVCCSSPSTDSSNNKKSKKGKFTNKLYMTSAGDTLSCFNKITYDEFAIHLKSLYKAYREKIELPKNWIDSDFCDCNYFYTRMQLQDKDYMEFKDAFASPCLSELLAVLKIKTIREMRKHEEEIIAYMRMTELGGMEKSYIDSAKLQKLIGKYSLQAEECLFGRVYKNNEGRDYVEMCNFMMTGAILAQVRQKWADPGFMYFYLGDPELDTSEFCFASELIVEYQFIEERDSLVLKRRFLNPCIILHSPVF